MYEPRWPYCHILAGAHTALTTDDHGRRKKSQVSTASDRHDLPPDWPSLLLGHDRPFMPLGCRIGRIALDALGTRREADHVLHAISEPGEEHPQSCFMDGVQAATGATFGKTLIEKTSWGEPAATFWCPGKPVARIPASVTQRPIEWSLSVPNKTIHYVQPRPDFDYRPVKGAFNKSLCSQRGEYVVERYVRYRRGEPVCIPCSGYLR